MDRPRILFLDAYDSFANNVTALLATLLQADVRVLPVDAPLSPAAFRRELRRYDAVVCGPGPGSPDCPADVGLMRWVWEATSPDDGPVTPALGICLGFQSLVTAHGGSIRRLPGGGLHGMVRALDAVDADIFAGVSAPFRATLYHSLGADVGQDALWTDPDWATPATGRRWLPLPGCPDLLPLAWLEQPSPQAPSPLLMAVRHRQLPFWGLQYHPESVCTDAGSHAVLVNWFRAARQWNVAHGRRVDLQDDRASHGVSHQATRPSLLSQRPSACAANPGSLLARHLPPADTRGLVAQAIALPDHVQVPDLVEALGGQPISGADEPEHIVLESASSPSFQSSEESAALPGRFSIVALDVRSALRIEHRAGDAVATLRLPGGDDEASGPRSETVALASPRQSVWQLLAEFHEARRLPDSCVGDAASPFFGGFMGFVTYEQGLHDIGVSMPLGAAARGHDRPDLCLAWITRSLVVDHVARRLYVQHLDTADSDADAWVQDTVRRLLASSPWQTPPASTINNQTLPVSLAVQTPVAADYEDKVRACQEFIAAGDSYELCLTEQTHVSAVSASAASWPLYRTLRRRNPAAFASYIRLAGATLVSSSPERFLRYGRDGRDGVTGDTVCSMHPVKGTVRRSAAVATLAQAEALLHVPKEEAENLMIVDLVRHDLHSVCGPGRVDVPALLQVEPQGRVFQMVSVVEGRLPRGSSATGLDVLAASLPPGSMTGAPKKRSCELLRHIEDERERSLYAGVVGYMCASGRGDWSVTIRSLFRWDDETAGAGAARHDVWHIGAGGAVTILSTAAGEREEMFTKLAGPLGIFEGAQ